MSARRDTSRRAISNRIRNPHFDNEKKSVEPHLLHEFEDDFYGSQLRILATGYLRPMVKAESLAALMELIRGDVANGDAAMELPAHAAHAGDSLFSREGE